MTPTTSFPIYLSLPRESILFLLCRKMSVSPLHLFSLHNLSGPVGDSFIKIYLRANIHLWGNVLHYHHSKSGLPQVGWFYSSCSHQPVVLLSFHVVIFLAAEWYSLYRHTTFVSPVFSCGTSMCFYLLSNTNEAIMNIGEHVSWVAGWSTFFIYAQDWYSLVLRWMHSQSPEESWYWFPYWLYLSALLQAVEGVTLALYSH